MEEKKDNKKKIIILGIITFIIIILSTTFAFYTWSSNTNQDIDVSFNLSGLDAYIHYNKGTDVLTGTLLPSTDYTGGISTEIELWKDASAASRILYGHIYMDITTIGTNLANEPALKWAITSNGEVLNTGDFVGQSNGNSISLKLNIPLQTTKQLFQIYIWLDESMEINDAIEGETISTIVRAEATELVYPQNAAEFVYSLINFDSINLNDDDPDGNVRYMGSDPNNYVSFNNELWRIIGAFKIDNQSNKVKLVRTESIGSDYWSTVSDNNWNNSNLKTYLNQTFYNKINTDSKNLISEEIYYLGGPTSGNFELLNSREYYELERSSIVYNGNPYTVIQNIGLIYPSDYGYASSGDCFEIELNKYNNGCMLNNYLNRNVDQWIQTPFSQWSDITVSLTSSGYINWARVNEVKYEMFPSLYLKSTVNIIGGSGTKDNPFVLE